MRGLRLGAVLVFLSGMGCSLLLSTAEPTQCTGQRDCDANPALRDRVCKDGFCVRPQEDPGQVSPPIDACSSTEHCTLMNGGQASVCRKAGGPCIPLATGPCETIRGEWQGADPIFIGTILPLTANANGNVKSYPYSKRVQRAMDLALAELNAAVPEGLFFPNAPRRRFALVHCDSSFDPAIAQIAMAHLTEVVGAHAVIVGSDHDLTAIRAKALEMQTSVVCSDCVAPFPSAPALAWRIVPPLANEAAMAAWRIGELEKQLKSGATPPSTLKVAILAAPDPAPAAFVSALRDKLWFNGKTASENGGAFLVRTAENAAVTTVKFEEHIAALTAFEPDVLVVAMGADFPAEYLPSLEMGWTPTKAKPHYVMTALNSEASPFEAVLGPDEDLRRRISGTRQAPDPAMRDHIESYELRYWEHSNFEHSDMDFSGYDAFYATAYAIAGAASASPVLDGPRIDAAFARLRSGPRFEVGPAKLGAALMRLAVPTESIDVHGLATHLDWDVTTRELTPVEVGLYCFERSGDGQIHVELDTGPRMDPVTGEVRGVYACD